MSVDISGFEDVSKERKSKVWINMLFHKQKGLALCKICLEKQFTRIVYAKNGSTKTASDHLKILEQKLPLVSDEMVKWASNPGGLRPVV